MSSMYSSSSTRASVRVDSPESLIPETIPMILRLRPSESHSENHSENHPNWISQFIQGFQNMIDTTRSKEIYAKIADDNKLTPEEKAEVVGVLHGVEDLYPALANFIIDMLPKVSVLKEHLEENDEVEGALIQSLSSEIASDATIKTARDLGTQVQNLISKVTAVLRGLQARIPKLAGVKAQINKGWWDYLSLGLVGLSAGAAIALTAGLSTPAVVGMGFIAASAAVAAVKMTDDATNPEYLAIRATIHEFEQTAGNLEAIKENIEDINTGLTTVQAGAKKLQGKVALRQAVVTGTALENFRKTLTGLEGAFQDLAISVKVLKRSK